MRTQSDADETLAPPADRYESRRQDPTPRAASDRRAGFDILLLPPAMTAAFPHAEQYAAVDVDGRQISYLEHGSFLVFANFAGLPALAAPAGLDHDGLPVGVQLVGPAWSDARRFDRTTDGDP